MTEADLELLLQGLDAQSDAVVVFDRDLRMRYINISAMAMAGVPATTAVGRRLTELAEFSEHFRDNAAYYAILEQVVGEVIAAGVEHVDDDSSRLTQEGEIVPVSVRFHPIRRGHDVLGCTFVIRDHTVDSSLMFRQAAVAMVHVDRDANVREANDALLAMLGRLQSDVRGRPFLDLVHPEDVPLVAPFLDDVVHRRTAEARLEARFVHADGSLRWTDLSMARNGMGGPNLGGACAIVQDITERVVLQGELESAQDQLRVLALHDPLTGLPNRALLADELAAAQRRATISGGHVAVLFIDLDGFKHVNDSGGHDVGDRLLVQAGERLKHLLRPDDVAARLGGDEFVLCCTDLSDDPEVARRDAQRIAERATQSLTSAFEIDGRRWTLGASIGIALSRGGDEEPATLLRHADAEMYRVKSRR